MAVALARLYAIASMVHFSRDPSPRELGRFD
jgi:hypothetical protein